MFEEEILNQRAELQKTKYSLSTHLPPKYPTKYLKKEFSGQVSLRRCLRLWTFSYWAIDLLLMRGTAVKLGWRIWGQGFQEKWRECVVKRGRVQHFYIFRNCILWKNFMEVNFTKVYFTTVFFNALFCPKVYFLYTSICLKCIFFPGDFFKNTFLDTIASYSSSQWVSG